MMLSFLTALISPITNIADKLIIDKDKYAEIQLRKIEIKAEARDKLLSITTTPTVDAMVKLAIAMKDVFIPLMRPVISSGMMLFAIYAANKGIELSAPLEAVLVAAFPAWGTARWNEKKDSEKTKRKEMEYTEWDDD